MNGWTVLLPRQYRVLIGIDGKFSKSTEYLGVLTKSSRKVVFLQLPVTLCQVSGIRGQCWKLRLILDIPCQLQIQIENLKI